MPGHWKFECPSLKITNGNNKINSILTSVRQENLSKQYNVNTNLSKTKVNVSMTDDDSGIDDKWLLPVGRLGKRFDKWKEITEDLYTCIFKVVKEGYILPLRAIPASIILKNNKSARENMSYVQEEVEGLIRKGVVSQVTQIPKVVNPLTVAYNRKGKPGLVLDCRHINKYLHTFIYKYEDIKVAEDMFEEGSLLFTFDIRCAYHSININQGSKTWLGFSLQIDGKVGYYVFNSILFGLSTSGHIFSKFLRVVVKFWRTKGHKIIMFLDDRIGGSTVYEKTFVSGKFARETLLSL